jgi:uncharacterized protein YndB with AHSA1/START domain
MEHITTIIDIARAPEDVFRYATDPNRFAEWQEGVVAVDIKGPDPLRPGSRFTTVRRIAGGERAILQEITEISPPRRWAVRTLEGPIKANAAITVEPLDGGARSRVTVTLDLDVQGLGALFRPVVRRQAAKGTQKSYENLKSRLEARQ